MWFPSACFWLQYGSVVVRDVRAARDIGVVFVLFFTGVWLIFYMLMFTALESFRFSRVESNLAQVIWFDRGVECLVPSHVSGR